jgi:hypothetical protein
MTSLHLKSVYRHGTMFIPPAYESMHRPGSVFGGSLPAPAEKDVRDFSEFLRKYEKNN